MRVLLWVHTSCHWMISILRMLLSCSMENPNRSTFGFVLPSTDRVLFPLEIVCTHTAVCTPIDTMLPCHPSCHDFCSRGNPQIVPCRQRVDRTWHPSHNEDAPSMQTPDPPTTVYAQWKAEIVSPVVPTNIHASVCSPIFPESDWVHIHPAPDNRRAFPCRILIADTETSIFPCTKEASSYHLAFPPMLDCHCSKKNVSVF
mmetsp:Transcript_29884/g.54744  ORF Transcript_29884/g.54744 Transcript_29884/m.54744 type:complete len:201 (+) Transcript_29884:264-866(+)